MNHIYKVIAYKHGSGDTLDAIFQGGSRKKMSSALYDTLELLNYWDILILGRQEYESDGLYVIKSNEDED